jgi:hypothetical protein
VSRRCVQRDTIQVIDGKENTPDDVVINGKN